MHDAVEIEFARAEDDVLTALLYLGGEQRIRLVHFPQSVQHFRQLRWVHGFHGDLHHRLCVVLEGAVMKIKKLSINILNLVIPMFTNSLT